MATAEPARFDPKLDNYCDPIKIFYAFRNGRNYAVRYLPAGTKGWSYAIAYIGRSICWIDWKLPAVPDPRQMSESAILHFRSPDGARTLPVILVPYQVSPMPLVTEMITACRVALLNKKDNELLHSAYWTGELTKVAKLAHAVWEEYEARSVEHRGSRAAKTAGACRSQGSGSQASGSQASGSLADGAGSEECRALVT